MANTSRPAPRQQRSWRAEQGQPMTPLGRRLRLGAIFLVGVVLVAWLIVALLTPRKPETQIAYLPVLDYQEMKAPVWPTALLTASDQAALAERRNGAAPRSLERMQESPAFARSEGAAKQPSDSELALDLRSLVQPDDRLLLLVSAQCASIDGQPAVLLTDFDASRAGGGFVPVSRLLEDLSDSGADRKVLILDAGNIVSDPRIGVLVNEFPRLLEEAVAKHDDPDLWVVCSHSPGEVSHVSRREKRSIFSYYVAKGLKGGANHSSGVMEADTVDLKELVDYLDFNVSEWVERARNAEGTSARTTQTPMVLKGGRGRVSEFSDVEAVPLVPVEERLPELPPAPVTAPPLPSTSARLEPRPLRRGTDRRVAANVLASGVPLVVAQSSPQDQPAGSESSATNRPSGDSAPSSPAEGATAPATEPEKTSDPRPSQSEGGKPDDEKPPTPPTPPQKPKPLPPSVIARQTAKIDEAWQLLDQIHQRHGTAGSPADFAPHFWREIQERLLVYETMLDYGKPAKAENQADVLGYVESNVLPVRQAWNDEPGATWRDSDVVAPLANEFERNRERQRDKFDPKSIVAQAEAARNDLMARLPYYVRWYAQASLLSPGDEPNPDTLNELIESTAELSGRLEAQWREADTNLDPQELQRLQRQAETLEERLQQNAPKRPGASAPNAAPSLERPPGASASSDEVSATAVECYLGTPLADARERAALTQWLAETSDAKEKEVFEKLVSDSDTRPSRRDPAVSPEVNWERVRRIAQLECALAHLAVPGDEGALDGAVIDALDSLDRRYDQFAQSVAGDRWDDCRPVGAALGRFYAELPGQIVTWRKDIDDERANKAAANPAQRAAVERLYRLLDARDADELAKEIESLVALRETDPTSQRPALLDFSSSPPSIELTPNMETAKLSLVARLEDGAPTDAWLVVQFDGARLAVVFDPASPTSAILQPSPGDVIDITRHDPTFNFRAGRERRFESLLLVTEKPAVKSSRRGAEPAIIEATLYYRDTDGRVEKHADLLTVPVRPSVPDVELIVDAPPEWMRANADGALTLRPFPNHQTDYRLLVQNHGEKPQKVNVELYAVPSALGELGPDRWPFRADGSLVDGVGRLDPLATGGCQVEPGQTAAVEFPLPAAAPAASETNGAAAPAPAPAPAASESSKPEPKPIPYGLVCVVEDGEKRRSVLNLRLDPQHPFDYLQVDVAQQDDPENQRRINVHVRPRLGPSAMPAAGSKVRWDWSRADVFGEKPKGRDEAELVPPDFQPQTLFVDMPDSHQGPVDVQLKVDGYPRAFTYTIDFDAPPIDVDPPPRGREERNLQDVRILSPEPKAAIDARTGLVPVDLEIDAPADAFDPSHPKAKNDRIEIGLVDPDGDHHIEKQNLKELHADRQEDIFFTNAAKDGRLTISTVVDDFQTSLPSGGVKNQWRGIAARLVRDGLPVAEVYREIYLDADKPEIGPIGQTSDGSSGEIRAEKGADVGVYAVVHDEGGVDQVEFLLAKREPPNRNPDDKFWKELPADKIIFGKFNAAEPKWEAAVPAGEQQGSFYLVVRATDQIGQQSVDFAPFTVTPPRDATGPPTRPMLGNLEGVIEGVTIVDSLKVVGEDFKRSVRPPGIRDRYRFAVKDLPHGKYTVEVTATARNLPQSRSVPVTIPQQSPLVISFAN